MKINDMARLAGITVRTLRYYDEIGLLPPAHTTPSGYRVYDESSLERLQQILFFRELDFPLSEIKELLDSPDYNRNEANEKTGSPALAEAGSFERFAHPFKAQNERRKRYELFGI